MALLYYYYFAVLRIALVITTNYHLFASEHEFNCSLATNNDTCILHCDEQMQNGLIFHCGKSASCVFQCESSQCLQYGEIHSQNVVHNLTIVSFATECLQSAVIYAPNYGNATFLMHASKSFFNMTVNCGTDTDIIFINCTFGTADECISMTVNAQYAQYLEITVGYESLYEGNLETMKPSNINCPQNSVYKGYEIASCIIDVSAGGALNLVNINTLNGIPRDVWIKTGRNPINNVNISCMDGVSVNEGNIFSPSSICWHASNITTNTLTSSTTQSSTNESITISSIYATERNVLIDIVAIIQYISTTNIVHDHVTKSNDSDIWDVTIRITFVALVAVLICLIITLFVLWFIRKANIKTKLAEERNNKKQADNLSCLSEEDLNAIIHNIKPVQEDHEVVHKKQHPFKQRDAKQVQLESLHKMMDMKVVHDLGAIPQNEVMAADVYMDNKEVKVVVKPHIDDWNDDSSTFLRQTSGIPSLPHERALAVSSGFVCDESSSSEHERESDAKQGDKSLSYHPLEHKKLQKMAQIVIGNICVMESDEVNHAINAIFEEDDIEIGE